MWLDFINMIIAGRTSVSGYFQKYTFYNVVHKEPKVQCQLSSVLDNTHTTYLCNFFFHLTKRTHIRKASSNIFQAWLLSTLNQTHKVNQHI